MCLLATENSQAFQYMASIPYLCMWWFYSFRYLHFLIDSRDRIRNEEDACKVYRTVMNFIRQGLSRNAALLKAGKGLNSWKRIEYIYVLRVTRPEEYEAVSRMLYIDEISENPFVTMLYSHEI